MSDNEAEEDDTDAGDGESSRSADSLANAHASRAASASENLPSRTRASKQPVAARAQSTKQDHLNKGYRELFNTTVQDIATSRSSGLARSGSYVGHTPWSSPEKEALFRQLGLSGAGDLKSLQRAIGSKSALQIRAYLLTLQEGVNARNSTASRTDRTREASQPSAFEISSDIEPTLGLAARTLAARVDRLDGDRERQRFGEEWLINEDVAYDWESRYEERLGSTVGNASQAKEDDDVKNDDEPPIASLDACNSYLLRPASFLQLSRSLFMNNNEDDELNWRHLDAVSADSDEPAIYRSALEDFQTIAVNITRRLVQATLFQAMSRLRAEDSSRADWTPIAAVRQIDARAAMEFLNMPSHRTYWENVTRRCRVAVYSESNKYKDGRPSTKIGSLLSHDEVEQEMGRVCTTAAKSRHINQKGVQSDDEQSMIADDLYTSEDLSDEGTRSEHDHEVARVDRGASSPAKRKRALSPRSAADAEDARLEVFDQRASFDEEQRIRKLLGLSPRPSLDHQATLPPSSSGVAVEDGCGAPGWREKLQYEAEWERPQKMVKSAQFVHMDNRGRVRRERRFQASASAQEQEPNGRATRSRQSVNPQQAENAQSLGRTKTHGEVLEISSDQSSSEDDSL